MNNRQTKITSFWNKMSISNNLEMNDIDFFEVNKDTIVIPLTSEFKELIENDLNHLELPYEPSYIEEAKLYGNRSYLIFNFTKNEKSVIQKMIIYFEIDHKHELVNESFFGDRVDKKEILDLINESLTKLKTDYEDNLNSLKNIEKNDMAYLYALKTFMIDEFNEIYDPVEFKLDFYQSKMEHISFVRDVKTGKEVDYINFVISDISSLKNENEDTIYSKNNIIKEFIKGAISSVKDVDTLKKIKDISEVKFHLGYDEDIKNTLNRVTLKLKQ